jgi:hypothetical protein
VAISVREGGACRQSEMVTRRTQPNPLVTAPTILRVAKRLMLWLSRSRNVDGLWVGSIEGQPWLGLRRVEDALALIKQHDPLNYSRICRNLERIWVDILPDAIAHYDRSLNACVFDQRFVLAETTTLGSIAASIVHEATHARLERCGIKYEEKLRPRIEAVCVGRELAFASKLPDGVELQEQRAYARQWYEANADYFSDARFRQRNTRGRIKALRYLEMPDWFIRAAARIERVRGLFRSRPTGRRNGSP